MRIIFTLALAFSVHEHSHCQITKQRNCYLENFLDSSQKVFTKMEVYPHYRGYDEQLNAYLISEIDIKAICSSFLDTVRVMDDSIRVRFIISRDSQMSNIDVISRFEIVAYEFKKALIKSSCDWFPGYSNRNLNAWYSGFIYLRIDRRNKALSVTVSSMSSQ